MVGQAATVSGGVIRENVGCWHRKRYTHGHEQGFVSYGVEIGVPARGPHSGVGVDEQH